MDDQSTASNLPYHKPALTVYGNIRTLTVASTFGEDRDNSTSPPAGNKTAKV